MKISSIFGSVVCALVLAALSSARADGPATVLASPVSGPQATFATRQYSFGRIMSGEIVKYDYVFTNTGSQVLEISKVQPSCGCTRAGDWTHHVAPGATGHIPIQFNSGNFRGDVQKSITVTSNDKLAPTQTLLLRGTIWRQLDVSPQYAYMTIVPDEPSKATTTIHITNNGQDPVTLSNPKSSSPSFTVEMKTVEAGKKYELLVTAVPPFQNPTTPGTITVQTSLARMKVLNVSVYAVSRPAMTVSPPQIMLPGTIDRWTTNTVSVVVNGAHLIKLSDPQVNDKRVSVQVREISEGRHFVVAAAFPPGFKISQGQRIEVTIKSDNKRQPLITVPITQLPHYSMAPYPVRPGSVTQLQPGQTLGHQ
jgi:hypothetical protein